MIKYLTKVLSIFILMFSFSGNIQATEISSSIPKDTVGTYPVTVSYYDKETKQTKQKTVNITVVMPRTVVEVDRGEAIDAKDIIVPAGTMKNIVEEDLIKLIQAKAWSLNDGSEVPIVKVELIVVNSTDGVYKVILETQKKTRTQVTILEMKEETILPGEEYINITGFYHAGANLRWGLIVLIVLLLLGVILLYIYTNKRVKKIDKILYEREKNRQS